MRIVLLKGDGLLECSRFFPVPLPQRKYLSDTGHRFGNLSRLFSMCLANSFLMIAANTLLVPNLHWGPVMIDPATYPSICVVYHCTVTFSQAIKSLKISHQFFTLLNLFSGCFSNCSALRAEQYLYLAYSFYSLCSTFVSFIIYAFLVNLLTVCNNFFEW